MTRSAVPDLVRQIEHLILYFPSSDFKLISVALLSMLPSIRKKGTSPMLGPVTLRILAPYSAMIRPMAGSAMMQMMQHSSGTLTP